MAGGGGGDAAERDRAGAELTPPGDVASVGRTFAAQFLDRRHRFLAQPRGLDRLGGLDHLLERGEHRLVLPARRACLSMPSSLPSRDALAARVYFAMLPSVSFSTSSTSRDHGQHADDARHRAVAAGGEVVAPEGVEHFGRRLQRLARPFLVAEIGVVGGVVADTLAEGLRRAPAPPGTAAATRPTDICRSSPGAPAGGRRSMRAAASIPDAPNRRSHAPLPIGFHPAAAASWRSALRRAPDWCRSRRR